MNIVQRIVSRYREDGINGLFKNLIIKIRFEYYKPKIVINKNHKTITLGNDYGGKGILDLPSLNNAKIISCGLGEDASFDVEFANKYNATVVIVDPTPRAIDHYNTIIEKIKNKGQKLANFRTENILKESYDLSETKEKQLVLEKFALWTEKTTLNFYLPINKNHVSHSIVNFQNSYVMDNEYDHIKVKTITISEIMDKHNINKIELLKLDIEGAEIEVLEKMLLDQIYPNQICVEFDGLNFPCKKAKSDFEKIDLMLRTNHYILIYYDGLADFTYLLNSNN
jgi:FkbM family methyltransferase